MLNFSLDRIAKTSTVLPLKEIGPHVVEIHAYDRAGNYKTARRIFMFDNETNVSLNNLPPTVTNADINGWVTEDKGHLEIKWNGSFSNVLHERQCWLCRVERSGNVSVDLEDTSGRSDRTIAAIPNVRGEYHTQLNVL